MMKHFSNLDLSYKGRWGYYVKKIILLFGCRDANQGANLWRFKFKRHSLLPEPPCKISTATSFPLTHYSICMGVAYDIIMKSYMMYRPSKFTFTK